MLVLELLHEGLVLLLQLHVPASQGVVLEALPNDVSAVLAAEQVVLGLLVWVAFEGTYQAKTRRDEKRACHVQPPPLRTHRDDNRNTETASVRLDRPSVVGCWHADASNDAQHYTYRSAIALKH